MSKKKNQFHQKHINIKQNNDKWALLELIVEILVKLCENSTI
jgi:hypothetical protein